MIGEPINRDHLLMHIADWLHSLHEIGDEKAYMLVEQAYSMVEKEETMKQYAEQVADILKDIHSDVFSILTDIQEGDYTEAENECRDLLLRLS